MPNKWQRSDWVISFVLFFALSTLFYATTSGITSSNDGSHYALARTLIENKTFTLNQFDDYAEGNDIAITPDGRLFSDRPPGTALLTTLFYKMGDLLPTPPTLLPSRHDADNPNLATVLLLPVLAGAATAVLLYAFSRFVGITQPGALTAVLFFALGTVQWKYSSVLFSHALSGFLVAASLYLVVRMGEKQGGTWWQALLLGLLLGFSVLVEYSNGLLVLIVMVYLLWVLRPFTLHHTVTIIGLAIAGGLISAAFLAFYNQVNFGSPFTLSYAFAVNYPWAGNFGTTFSYPLLAGLRALLYFGEGGGWCDPTCYNQGLLLLSPILIIAIPGTYFYCKQAKKVCLLTTAVFLIYLLLFAKHHTSHGFTGDGRYLLPFLGLLVMPMGMALDRLYAWTKRPLRHHSVQALLQMISFLIVYGLFFLSVRNIFLHIGRSYNYNLDLSQLDSLIARPQNWAYLVNSVLRNQANLPVLWSILGLILFVGLLIWGIDTTRKRPSNVTVR